MSTKQLVDHFAGLDDPRCDGKVEHRLIDILVIAVCAVIAGAESWGLCCINRLTGASRRIVAVRMGHVQASTLSR